MYSTTEFGRMASPSAMPFGAGSVLIVDDDPMIRRLLEMFLIPFGLKTRTAANGELALELFAQEPDGYAAVLMDVEMPRLSGPDALRKLRAIDPTVPVIFITGDSGQLTREELASLGFCEVVQKPFDCDGLVKLLTAAIQKRSVRREQAKTCRQRELQGMTRGAIVSAWRNTTKKSDSDLKPVGELIEEILRAEFR